MMRDMGYYQETPLAGILCKAILFPDSFHTSGGIFLKWFTKIELSIYAVFYARVQLMRYISEDVIHKATEELMEKLERGLSAYHNVDVELVRNAVTFETIHSDRYYLRMEEFGFLRNNVYVFDYYH